MASGSMAAARTRDHPPPAQFSRSALEPTINTQNGPSQPPKSNDRRKCKGSSEKGIRSAAVTAPEPSTTSTSSILHQPTPGSVTNAQNDSLHAEILEKTHADSQKKSKKKKKNKKKEKTTPSAPTKDKRSGKGKASKKNTATSVPTPEHSKSVVADHPKSETAIAASATVLPLPSTVPPRLPSKPRTKTRRPQPSEPDVKQTQGKRGDYSRIPATGDSRFQLREAAVSKPPSRKETAAKPVWKNRTLNPLEAAPSAQVRSQPAEPVHRKPQKTNTKALNSREFTDTARSLPRISSNPKSSHPQRPTTSSSRRKKTVPNNKLESTNKGESSKQPLTNGEPKKDDLHSRCDLLTKQFQRLHIDSDRTNISHRQTRASSSNRYTRTQYAHNTPPEIQSFFASYPTFDYDPRVHYIREFYRLRKHQGWLTQYEMEREDKTDEQVEKEREYLAAKKEFESVQFGGYSIGLVQWHTVAANSQV